MSELTPVTIDKPFDPASLKVEVKNSTVDQLRLMLKNNLIDLQPDFQRSPNLWTPQKKSRLIESIILGIPLPSFYFYIDSDKEKWVVIDGLQRLCSIQDFMVAKTLRLRGLEFLKDRCEGKSYDDFSYFDQLNMSMRSVTLNIISGVSSVEAQYIIFKRINSTGTMLSPAEIHNALFHGRAMELVKKMATSLQFKDATHYQVDEKRLLHQDYVLRFVAFYVCGYENYTGNMESLIGHALDFINKKATEADIQQIRSDFYESLSLSTALLGDDSFRNPKSPKANKTAKAYKVSISLFEATACGLARLSAAERSRLLSHRVAFHQAYRQLFENKDFRGKLSNGTNQKKSVITRFSMLESIINKYKQ